jgi:cellulose synthase/poly-beta-1,6-N-acetylglucosamine synthase-like glycosyltransferase
MVGAGEGIEIWIGSKKMGCRIIFSCWSSRELFAIRTALYTEKDTILDDFIISLRVAQEGYTIQYDPEAYAIETAR